MTTVSDIRNRLSADAQFPESEFYSAVFSYGMGVIELLTDGGYAPGEYAYVELEANLGSAEVFTEGQALGSPVESTVIKPAFAFKNFRAVVRSSGDERRALGDADQGARIADPGRKVARAIEAIRYLMAKTFDDAAIYGIQGIISASTYNFGDTSRTTYTKLASYELDGSSAAISSAILNNFTYRSAEDPYGCKFDAVITSGLQAGKIAELGSQKLAIPSAGGVMNLIPTGLAVGAAPLYIMPNLTTSAVLGLTGVGAGKWKWAWHEPNPGRFHVLDLGADNSDTVANLQISTSGCMYCVNPQEQGKLHSLSTT
jgi:hypothetical protein